MRKLWWAATALTGGIILFGASPLGNRATPPAATESPAPVASEMSVRTGPATPRPTTTPDDPRLHEEPVETDEQ